MERLSWSSGVAGVQELQNEGRAFRFSIPRSPEFVSGMIRQLRKLLQLLNSSRCLPLELTMPLVYDNVPIGFPGWDHWHDVLGKWGHHIKHKAFIRIQHALHGRL